MRRDHRFDRLDLIALHVEQEHVRRIGRHAHRKLVDQVLLQRADADDEEAAEADGEQHDAHLAAGAAELQDCVAKRERSRSRQGPNRANQQAACEMQDERGGGKSSGDHRPDPQRAGLPHGQGHDPGDHEDRHRNLHEVRTLRA